MKLNTLAALAVAGAFALPLAAHASVDGDRIILAQSGGPAGASATGTGPTGGVPSPQTAGEPATQKDRTAPSGASAAHCESMTGSARDKCLSDAAAAGASSTTGASVGSSSTTSPTGTTAGPGSASSRTGSGSDTATTPGTSGQGKAQ
jgi:hypothetical protein